MKYTSSQVRQMTWPEWNDAMARELNENGYKARGFNPETRRWENNREPYKADPSDTKVFIMGIVGGAEEYECLKRAGLLNNGRYPMCGNPIYGNPGRFTSGYDHNTHFQICQDCCNKGRLSSLNPANISGCIMALILMPWHLNKTLFN